MRESNFTIEFNDLFREALDLMENSVDTLFITGKAGTGKSTLLEYFRTHTRKRVVVLAPTGVAAINVRGETVHSFFRFKPDITLDKVRKIRIKRNQKSIYRQIDAIVIDEISMVRADLLDCVDKFLRLNGPDKELPFGGVQMIFIGDLYQLPPVTAAREKALWAFNNKSPYFFDSTVFQHLAMKYLELEKIYRQKDKVFIQLLNSIRNNSVTEKEISLLNWRYKPDFETQEDYYIYLTTTNKMATAINNRQLDKLSGKLHAFRGEIQGEFDKKRLPTEIELKLKKNSQIMLLNNDPAGRWVNGTIGKIIEIGKNEITVELKDGQKEKIKSYQWDIFHFDLNQKTGQLQSDVIGQFKQFPLRLAWAITIHKSQGKTFENVVLDIGRGAFAHGQTYVALSRCTSLSGIILKKPIKKSHIIMDWRVVNFVTRYQYMQSEKLCPLEQKIAIIHSAIKDKACLKIIYLKTKDEKTDRLIRPMEIGKMEYMNKKFWGLKAYCLKRRNKRVFRLDRMLEIRVLPEIN